MIPDHKYLSYRYCSTLCLSDGERSLLYRMISPILPWYRLSRQLPWFSHILYPLLVKSCAVPVESVSPLTRVLETDDDNLMCDCI